MTLKATTSRRKRSHDRMSSRCRRTIESAFSELVCPITRSLPVDPVHAEDGGVYERSAIAEWLQRNGGRSPRTNRPMGPTLLPAPHVRNLIRRMVEEGVITDKEIVDEWHAKLEDEARFTALRREAEEGSAVSMCNLGLVYRTGSGGIAVDTTEAFRWYQKSHEAGNAGGTASIGMCYLHGEGVEASQELGIAHTAIAAERGSALACVKLGDFCRSGIFGFPRDEKLACEWYAKADTAAIKDITPGSLEMRAAYMRKRKRRNTVAN